MQIESWFCRNCHLGHFHPVCIFSKAPFALTLQCLCPFTGVWLLLLAIATAATQNLSKHDLEGKSVPEQKAKEIQ